MKSGSELSYIEINVDHHPLGSSYSLLTPTIEINGVKEKKHWGKHSYQMPPGNYYIAVSYPWLFNKECGKNHITFTLGIGEIKRVNYRAPWIKNFKGKISVS